MAEKKDKRAEVRSSSFREIINGEVVGVPQPEKTEKQQEQEKAKAAKKAEAKPVSKTDKEFVERMIAFAGKPGKKEELTTDFGAMSNEACVAEHEENGQSTQGGIIEAPEAKKAKKETEKGGHVQVEVTEGEPEKIERSLKNSTMEGVFNSASGSIQSSFTTPFALALGASNAEIGILNSLQNLAGTVSHVPGAMLTKYFNRKAIWVFSQIVARIIIWIPILFLPFLGVESRVWVLIALIVASNFFLMLRSPAWSSLMGDLVSVNIRGSYFGKRNMLIGMAGVLVILAAGFMLVYWGFSAIFLLSMIFAAVAILFFVRMYEPPAQRVFHYTYKLSLNLRGFYNNMRLNKEFTIFTLYMTCMNFAMDVAAPFYVVYMLKDLSIGYELFAIAVVVGALARAFCQQYWGRLNDRFGSRIILIVCGILACFVPFGWLFAANIWHVLGIKIYEAFAFAGFELVIFNYLLEVTPAKDRPKYIASHNFFTGFGMVFGGLFGALLVHSFEGASLFGLAALQIVFVVSFVLRLSCLSFLSLIKNIDIKQSDLVPVRYVFWHAVAVEPARGIKHTITYTFRYPSHVEEELRNSVKKLEYMVKLKMNK